MAGAIHNCEFCRPHVNWCWLTGKHHAIRHFSYPQPLRIKIESIT